MHSRTVWVDAKQKHLAITFMFTGGPGTVVDNTHMSAERWVAHTREAPVQAAERLCQVMTEKL